MSNSPTDPYRAFADIAVSAARLCDAQNSVVFQLADGELRLLARYGPLPTAVPVGQAGFPFTRGSVIARAIIDKVTIHVADVQIETKEYPEGSELARRVGHRTIVAVPLMRAGEAIGAISVRRAQVRPFTDRQIELLKTFADQAVIAIENTRLFEAEQVRTRELSEALEQQIATSKVLEIISSSTGDLQHVLPTLLENATRLCRANFGNLFLREENEFFRLVATHNAPPQWAAWWQRTPVIRPHPRSPLGRNFNKEIVHVVDLASEPPYIERDPTFVALVDLAGARAIVSVPMLKDGEVLGVVAIYSQELRPFTAKQIELLKTFADQAVIAIENTRLFEAEPRADRSPGTADRHRRCLEGHQPISTRRAKSTRCVGRVRSTLVQCL
jgi:GAF domain-containing protein